MNLSPQEGRFFEYFEQLAAKLQEGGRLFIENLNDFENSRLRHSKLKEVENEADRITHKIYRMLHDTFITPLDREDIYALANTMDSVLDMIEAASARMYLYRIQTVAPEVKELVHILNKSISCIKTLTHLLGQSRKNPGEILELCKDINTLENEADTVLRKGMARLFQEESDAIELLKCKEMLERIETATDICEDVSNVVEGIILKHG